MVNTINSSAEHSDEKEALSGVSFFLKHCYIITNQIFQNKVIFFECLITLRFLRTGHVAPFAARPTCQVFPFQEQHIMSYSGMILMLLITEADRTREGSFPKHSTTDLPSLISPDSLCTAKQ